jgi:hypothetical protein
LQGMTFRPSRNPSGFIKEPGSIEEGPHGWAAESFFGGGSRIHAGEGARDETRRLFSNCSSWKPSPSLCHPSASLLMTKCRTYGARILFGIDFPALPGWADVWRSALRASHPWRLPVSFLSQLATGNSTARDDKGKGVAYVYTRRPVERTAGTHSTSLRAGSPLRLAPVGMTILILVGCECQEKLY